MCYRPPDVKRGTRAVKSSTPGIRAVMRPCGSDIMFARLILSTRVLLLAAIDIDRTLSGYLPRV